MFARTNPKVCVKTGHKSGNNHLQNANQCPRLRSSRVKKNGDTDTVRNKVNGYGVMSTQPQVPTTDRETETSQTVTPKSQGSWFASGTTFKGVQCRLVDHLRSSGESHNDVATHYATNGVKRSESIGRSWCDGVCLPKNQGASENLAKDTNTTNVGTNEYTNTRPVHGHATVAHCIFLYTA